MKTRLATALFLALALPALLTAADPQPPELRLPAVAHPVLMDVELTILQHGADLATFDVDRVRRG